MSTAAITFEPLLSSRRTHDACARLGGGVSLYVSADGLLDEVSVSRVDAAATSSFRLTAAQARALGAELLAAAAAVDTACGVAVQQVEG